MVYEVLLSTKKSIGDKIKSPFFGTLIIVFLIHNWRLLYAPFHFPDNYSLEEKIKYISAFLDGWSLLYKLGTSILWTMLALVLSYFLLALSRYLHNLYRNRLIPYINSISSFNENVPKEYYENVVKDRDQFIEWHEKLKLSKIELEKEIEDVRRNYDSKVVDFNNLNSRMAEIRIELGKKEKELDAELKKTKKIEYVDSKHIDINIFEIFLNNILYWQNRDEVEKRKIYELFKLAFTSQLWDKKILFGNDILNELISKALLDTGYNLTPLGRFFYENMENSRFKLIPNL
ncbi:MAG: hypothetical protein RBS73_09795 [Prolixibacteraceae bacterium]|jgi:hypothetical protein|nr:hypothetical protein [Prolixibacteraceae bacterium]